MEKAPSRALGAVGWSGREVAQTPLLFVAAPASAASASSGHAAVIVTVRRDAPTW